MPWKERMSQNGFWKAPFAMIAICAPLLQCLSRKR